MGCLAKAVPERVSGRCGMPLGGQLRGGPSIDRASRRSNRVGAVRVLFFNSGGNGVRPFAGGMSATASRAACALRRAVEPRRPSDLEEKFGPFGGRKPLAAAQPDRRGGPLDGADGRVRDVRPRESRPRPQGRRRRCHAASWNLPPGTALKAMGYQIVPADDQLRLSLPGGAGWRSADRPPERVAADVADGLIARGRPARLRRGTGCEQASTTATKKAPSRRNRRAREQTPFSSPLAGSQIGILREFG